MSKICAKCKLKKDLSEFSKLSRASDGLNYRCKVCCSEYYNSLYDKIKIKKSENQKIYYQKNKDKIIEKIKLRYDSNKKKIYNKIYNKLNKDSINHNKNIYEINRVKNDPHYRLIKIMRKMVHRILNNKKDSTFKLLGYNKNDLLNELGRCPNKDEHIDHKIPVSWFIKETPIYIISHFKNLQIISKEQNFKKLNTYSDLVDYEFYLIAINYIKENYKNKVKHYEHK
jgi:hypothetical protein